MLTPSPMWPLPHTPQHKGMREGHEKSVTLHGVEGEVLAAFLQFLYCTSCDVAVDKLVALAALADQYDVGGAIQGGSP